MESVNHAEAVGRIAALEESGAESGLLLVGERGLGKSHVLEQAHAGPASTVLVKVHPSEAGFQLAGFASLFSALRHEPASEFHRYFQLRSDDPSALFAAAHDLLALISGLSLPPTVALIDDVDLLDDASGIVLDTIVTRLAGTSLWLVGTATRPPASVSGFDAARLLPLTADQLVENACADSDQDESTLRILANYCDGNPRILAEHLTQLHGDRADSKDALILPPRLTPTIEQVTQATIDHLGDTSREILELIALAPIAHESAISELIPDPLDLDDLVDAGLLRRQGPYVSFNDARLRSRFYWDQGSKARRRRHADLTQACTGHDRCLTTWHASSADRGPTSVEPLLLAGLEMAEAGRVCEAIEFVERALGRVEHLQQHAATLIRLCNHLLTDGHVSLGDRYSSHPGLRGAGEAETVDLLVIRLLTQLYNKRHLVDDEVVTIATLHAPANPEGAISMLTLAAYFRAERWEIDEARRLASAAMDLQRSTGHPGDVPRAIWELLDSLEGHAATVDDPAETPPLHDVDPLALPAEMLLARARSLTFREDHQEARHLYNVMLNHPPLQNRTREDLAIHGTALNEIAAGEFRLARAALESWSPGSVWVHPRTAIHSLLAAWRAYSVGQVDEALALIELTLERASSEASQSCRARALALRGAVHVLTGDAEAAVMDLRQVSAASTRFRNPGLLRHWADYTEVCVATGRVQEASAAVAALERRLSTHSSRWGSLALLRCRALVGSGGASLALFDDAVKAFERDEAPYELGRTLACLADRQDDLGMTVEARRTRMAAVAAFESAGADAWAARLDQPARAATSQAPSLLEQLSVDEREVAQRVVQGLRNREIAQALFVSVRTVELRLTRIYRALGVHSRAQLVAVLTGAGVPDSPADGTQPHA